MTKQFLFFAYLFFVTGCASTSMLAIQPTDNVTVEVPSEMFSSLRMRDGEILFLKGEQIVGFVKSDQVPNTFPPDNTLHLEQALFQNASKGSQKPSWINGVTGAAAFQVINKDFTTIFVVPKETSDTLITLQGPVGHSRSVRINGTSASDNE